MGRRFPRVVAFLDSQFALVAVVLVVLAAAGGYVTYATHVEPGTTTVERQGPSWSTAGQFDHGATVRENNSVFPVGTTLSNRSVYFSGIAPRLDGRYAFGYEASESGSMDVSVSLALQRRGIRGEGETTTVLWQTSDRITTRNGSLAPGDSLNVPFSIDVDRAANRTARIREELGNPGEVQTRVVAAVHYEGTVNGESVDETVRHALPIRIREHTYQVVSPGQMGEEHDSTRTVTVQARSGPVRRVGGPVLLGTALLALGALVGGRRYDRLDLDDAERERLAYRDDRSDFDEWISTIRLPDSALRLPRAEADSLADLVDFAIDTDNGVIEDPDEEAFYVVHDGHLYVYRPPELPAEVPDDETDADVDGDADADDGESVPAAADGGVSGDQNS